MAKNILIVESPAKAKTLKKYLGKDFEILASYGHVRDLIPKTGAVDPEHHFKMKYALIEKNEKHLDAIAKAMKQSEKIKKCIVLYFMKLRVQQFCMRLRIRVMFLWI